jgi:hypothetical protein
MALLDYSLGAFCLTAQPPPGFLISMPPFQSGSS